jgi:hypothetical protein
VGKEGGREEGGREVEKRCKIRYEKCQRRRRIEEKEEESRRQWVKTCV